MRIFHITMVIPNLGGGGAERSVLRTAKGLADRGHKVDIVIFSPILAYPRELPPNVRLIVLQAPPVRRESSCAHLPEATLWWSERVSRGRLAVIAPSVLMRFSVASPALLRRGRATRVLRLAHYFERERPDFVFANLPKAEIAAWFAARVARGPPLPVVPVLRNWVRPGAKETRRRRALLYPDSRPDSAHLHRDAIRTHEAPHRMLRPENGHFVAISRGVAETASAALGVPESKISVIYNPAFSPAFAQRAEATPDHPWFADAGPPIMLGVGRLAEQKDFPTLIEAFRRVSVERPCRLLILGDGPLRADLEALGRKHGLEDRLSLPGWSDNPFAFMARAALFALSSRHEGFGNVLVEAMPCGCPTVSTDCQAGPSEILEDADLLAPVGDPEALAKVMLRVLARPADRAALRAKAARFSVSQTVDGYEQLMVRLDLRSEISLI